MAATASKRRGPLDGVKVVDMTTVVMGPYATQILAELGADVIKVEPPEGDITRNGGPMRNPRMGHRFLHLNKGKRSIALNAKNPRGREALLKLVQTADVLVYNVRPAAMARLGLRFEDVARVNPKLIYVGAYGFSQSGPYAARPAYDDLIQAMVGLPWLTAKAGGGEPRYVPATLFDRVVGLHIVYAVTAALFERTRTGKGQEIEVPMFEAIAELVLSDHLGGRTFDPPLGPSGYERVLAADRRPYRTKDGYVCVLIYSDKQWESFLREIGRADELEKMPDLAKHEGRAKAPDVVNRFIAGHMLERTTAEWIELLSRADIPASELSSLDDVIDDPHLAQAGALVAEPHPSEGALLNLAQPTRWPDHPRVAPRPAPRLSEHGRELLRELGYSDTEIDDLAREGGVVLEPR
ncbi:MAG TPA: CoA transferase [Burkholderiales bacterium]|nr:CoA transferase [Burkholderiales bacterium]